MSYEYLSTDDWFAQQFRQHRKDNPDFYKMSEEDIIREEAERLDEDGKDTQNYRYGKGEEIMGENNPNWRGGKLERPCGWRVYPELAGTYGRGVPRPDMVGESGVNAKKYTCPNCGKGPMPKGPYGTHKRLSASCSEYFSQLA
jgi:hypothetical protein